MIIMDDRWNIVFDQELREDQRPKYPGSIDSDIISVLISFLYLVPFMLAFLVSQLHAPNFYQSPIVHLIGGPATFLALVVLLLGLFILRLVTWLVEPYIKFVAGLLPFADAHIRFILTVFVLSLLLVRFLVRPLRRYQSKLEASYRQRRRRP